LAGKFIINANFVMKTIEYWANLSKDKDAKLWIYGQKSTIAKLPFSTSKLWDADYSRNVVSAIFCYANEILNSGV